MSTPLEVRLIELEHRIELLEADDGCSEDENGTRDVLIFACVCWLIGLFLCL